MEFESINYKCLLALNSNFTYFILYAVISILELFWCIATYVIHTVFTNRASMAAVQITRSCISSSSWVKVIFAIGNHKNIQTRDCCPLLCLWLAHCINITLFCCCRFTLWLKLLQEFEEFERGHSSLILLKKRREFGDQRGLFYKRSLHFGIKNLKLYSRMNTYSR